MMLRVTKDDAQGDRDDAQGDKDGAQGDKDAILLLRSAPCVAEREPGCMGRLSSFDAILLGQSPA